ncbi:MAG TPA: tRNA 2-thiouridine(34) synthase MnmA [Armatimonadota bacterium]|nr:tRNA 2-thiouridine(34) synthase MnmA [Armatimonadota bacterium]
MSGERVAVAMSGGVDSSVAAALLLEQGYEVVGFTMQIWPRDMEAEVPAELRGCCGVDAVDSARRVARTLDIRHYVLNLREAFERFVIDPFCDEYARGRTPNPCIRCNTFVKFGPLLRRAREIEAEKLATGHYARVAYDERVGRWKLLQGADVRKDQSYSLYGLSQEQLSRAVFPLGEMTKQEVRRRAGELGLASAERPESQEICFIAGEGYREYLARRRPEVVRPGPIVDREGRQVGRHRGVAFYTIGQRQGLGVAHGRPLYVVGIEVEANRLIVGEEEEGEFRGLMMGEVNYVSLAGLPAEGMVLAAKIRSGGRPAACGARPEGGRVRVEFEEPQWAVSPGQGAVCYEGEAVALGGTIEAGF